MNTFKLKIIKLPPPGKAAGKEIEVDLDPKLTFIYHTQVQEGFLYVFYDWREYKK